MNNVVLHTFSFFFFLTFVLHTLLIIKSRFYKFFTLMKWPGELDLINSCVKSSELMDEQMDSKLLNAWSQ
jgi:hypothetical protein